MYGLAISFVQNVGSKLADFAIVLQYKNTTCLLQCVEVSLHSWSLIHSHQDHRAEGPIAFLSCSHGLLHSHSTGMYTLDVISFYSTGSRPVSGNSLCHAL